MNTSVRSCFVVFLTALLIGLAAFLFSLLGIFSFEFVGEFLWFVLLIAFVLYAIVFKTLLEAEKSRVIREAVCCCGKLTLIGLIGTIISALLTLLLYESCFSLLFDLGIGFVFFFITLMLSGMCCIITAIYQCRRNDC